MELYDHQWDILRYLTENKTFAVFAEQGCGKTIPMLMHIYNLFSSGKIKDCLIIAPKFPIGSWKSDIDKFPPHIIRVLNRIVFINYEKVWRRKEYDRHFDCVILDEAHNIAHKGTAKTKFILKYNSRSEYRYMLTGTPMGQGNLESYWSEFEFLEHGFLDTYKEFDARYLIRRQLPNSYVKIIVGFRNKDELLERIKQKSYYIRKKDCLYLPDKLPDILIHCANYNRTVQAQLRDGYIKSLDMVMDNILIQRNKDRQLANGFVYDNHMVAHEFKCEKPMALDSLLDSLESEKVIIFFYFKYTKSQIIKVLNKRKLTFLTLDGETSDATEWCKFNDTDDYDVMLCQYKSANSGINLQSASHMIFYEPDTSTTNVEQARDRMHRIGQKWPCSYYWLLTEGSIDDAIYNNLKEEQDFTMTCYETLLREKRDERYLTD